MVVNDLSRRNNYLKLIIFIVFNGVVDLTLTVFSCSPLRMHETDSL